MWPDHILYVNNCYHTVVNVCKAELMLGSLPVFMFVQTCIEKCLIGYCEEPIKSQHHIHAWSSLMQELFLKSTAVIW